MPGAKARAVLDEVCLTLDPERCYAALEISIATHLCNITGDGYRDLERVEREGQDLFVGYHGQLRRLLASVSLDTARQSARIEIIATKGGLDVLDENAMFGDSGPEIGNSILVARLLHVGICTLRQQGVHAIVNTPYNERLRQHYITMGFERGEQLSLRDESALRRAFEFIDFVYRSRGLALQTVPP